MRELKNETLFVSLHSSYFCLSPSTWLRNIKLGLIVCIMVTAKDEPIGHRLRLNCRENNMARISDDYSPSPTTIGSINQLVSVAGIGDYSFDGGRLWTDYGNHAVGRHDVAEADVDQLNVHKN